jgi:hypothetical protein
MTADGDRDEAAGGRDDAVVRHGDGRAPRPGEEALFEALDRTRADLAAAPVPPLPTGFAAQLQARIAAERAAAGTGTPPRDPSSDPPTSQPSSRPPSSQPPSSQPPSSQPPSSQPGHLAPSRPSSSRPLGRAAADTGPGRDRRHRRVLAAGLAALAVVAVVTGGLLAAGGGPTTPAPTAAPAPVGPPAPAPAPLSADDPVRALRTGLGARDPGPLADPARRAACLVAHGLPAGTVPLGSRQVVLDGRPGTLLVLPTGTAARFRLLVVGPDCTARSPETLADLTVGG